MRFNNKGIRFDLYKNKSMLKWGILGISFLITTVSIIFTQILVGKLKGREKKQIELYAKTIEYASNQNRGHELYFLVEQIIQPNNSIPVILTDSYGIPKDYKNVDVPSRLNAEQKKEFLLRQVREMNEVHKPIKISLIDENDQEYDFNYIYYQNSILLTQLKYYPFVQLGIIAFFAFFAYLGFNYNRLTEQNRVWVGLAKETAHQLGTPLSSLMAWVEYLKIDPDFNNPEVITELEKDIHKLEMITNRFSSIGSIPVLKLGNLVEVITENVNYLQKRISYKVKIYVEAEGEIPELNFNRALFDWVIENLCKNAVDAMDGIGFIKINIREDEKKSIIIDVNDNGKGITKSKAKQVFQPGFSTKKRGWGLGLTLVKRIIEDYHDGKISILKSEVGIGTTFRIILDPKRLKPSDFESVKNK